jgi:site-specific DNA recombinase
MSATHPDLVRAAIYLRVSTDDQRDRDTIANQRDAAAQYVANHNISVFDRYADDGISGAVVPIEQRPQGARLLADAQSGKFSSVVVYNLRRLGRGFLGQAAFEALRRAGITVISITEPHDFATPSGAFIASMLFSMGGYERDTNVQASIEATNRLARAGVWLGGIVPYGYRKVGIDASARIVVSDDLLPGTEMSEAGVIRLIFNQTVEHHQSCQQIADLLNTMNIPPSYTKDGRELKRGKRIGATAAIWRPARIRNMIINTTYKGLHQYGKRSKKQRQLIEREVPAIVNAQTWARAQEVLSEHFLFNKRNAKRTYILRGLMKCDLCGLTYIGQRSNVRGEPQWHYICNGKHQSRGLYGLQGKKCPSRTVRAVECEDTIWAEIETFLCNPGEALQELMAGLAPDNEGANAFRTEAARLQRHIASKEEERQRILTLWRKRLIGDVDLESQLNDIEREKSSIKTRLDQLQDSLENTATRAQQLTSVEATLNALRARLDQPLDRETKRELIALLTKYIRVETLQERYNGEAEIHVGYYFTPQSSTDNRTGTDSSPRSASRSPGTSASRSRD